MALYPASVAAVTASDSTPLAWKGDLLALGVFEEAITPGMGEGTPCSARAALASKKQLLWRTACLRAPMPVLLGAVPVYTVGLSPRTSQHA